MKLILLSPSDKKESELALIVKMFEEGLQTYHLRKVKYSTRQLKSFIEEIPQKYHNRIVIHTHHELVMNYDLKGVYISRSHKKRKLRTWLRMQWFKFRKRELMISATVRSIEDVLDTNSKYNYVFLSPVFDSQSGNSQAGFTEHNLRSSIQHAKLPVIARGGVSIENISKANEMGFDGVAFYSNIWKAKSPLEEFRRAKEKFIELKIPME